MKRVFFLTTMVLVMGVLAAPVLAEVEPVVAMPVSIDGKYTDGIRPLTPEGRWAVDQAKRLGVKLTGKSIDYVLTITEETLDVAGVEFPVWAFGNDGEKGTVPGPAVAAVEGDFVRVIVKNKSRNNHTMHMHGITITHYRMDGVPAVSQEPIKPDHQFVYEFVAAPVGTHMYHCHVNAHEHIDMGMYGPLIVLPQKSGADLPKGWQDIDQDVVLMLDEWDSTFSKEEGFEPTTAEEKQSLEMGHPRRMSSYNFFTINGNAFTDERPNVLLVKPGEKVRVRFINIGYWPHAMHFHGHSFVTTHIDGYKVSGLQRADTVHIIAGQTMDVVFEANQDGRFVWHCHVVPHSTNDGVYHGGMLLAVAYPGALDPQKFPLGKPTKIAEGGEGDAGKIALKGR